MLERQRVPEQLSNRGAVRFVPHEDEGSIYFANPTECARLPALALPLDQPSKRILFAWIASDILWTITFIRARKRHEQRAGGK